MTELTWAQVEAVAGIDPQGLVGLFAGRSEIERLSLIPDLYAGLKKFKTVDYDEMIPLGRLLRIAGPAVLDGPAAIVRLLARRNVTRSADGDEAAIVRILQDREPAWLAEIAVQLAAKEESVGWEFENWQVVDDLVRLCDLDMPLGEGIAAQWARTAGYGGVPLYDALAGDRHLPVMLPRLFEVKNISYVLSEWGDALNRLAEEGKVDRRWLVGRCLARMAGEKDDWELDHWLPLYAGLGLTLEESAAHVPEYISLLGGPSAGCAVLAQTVLKDLDEAGLLTGGQVAEASAAAFGRTERKFHKVQLPWLGKAVARHPEDLAALLTATVGAFRSAATDVQERGARLIARNLRKLEETQREHVLDAVKTALPRLSEAVRPEAVVLLGLTDALEPEPPAPALPAFEVRQLPPPIGSLDELVAALTAFFSGKNRIWWSHGIVEDPLALERILAAMVREDARDRLAFAEALDPVAQRFELIERTEWFSYRAGDLLGDMVAVVVSGMHEWLEERYTLPLPGLGSAPEPQIFLLLRLCETALRLVDYETGPYLSEPATASGYVDPAALLQGLKEWEAQGSEPWQWDVEQAVMRLPQEIPDWITAEAATLTSITGKYVAQVMADGGLPRCPVSLRLHRHWHGDRHLPTVNGIPNDHYEELAGFRRLHRLDDPMRYVNGSRYMPFDDACWPLILPGHRDLIAAHLAARLAPATRDEKGYGELLPLLAAGDGPVGEGLSTALLFGLAAKSSTDYKAARSAFLTLAVRGEDWDPADTGRTLAVLLDHGELKFTQLAESLRSVVKSGAHEATWRLMTGLLPDLLTGTPHAKTGDLLAIAVECAAKSGARGSIPEVDALAEKPGKSRTVVAARRLKKILAGEN